jgi:hypothetical protein
MLEGDETAQRQGSWQRITDTCMGAVNSEITLQNSQFKNGA